MKLSLRRANRSNAANLRCYECGREGGRERERERCMRREEDIGEEKGERKEMRPFRKD